MHPHVTVRVEPMYIQCAYINTPNSTLVVAVRVEPTVYKYPYFMYYRNLLCVLLVAAAVVAMAESSRDPSGKHSENKSHISYF